MENNNLYCIYCVHNTVTGDTYVGQHKYQDAENPLGNYWGSGVQISYQRYKYGKNNLKRHILLRNIKDKRHANLAEMAFIKSFRQYGLANLNLSDGQGNGGANKGQKRTLEQRLRFSKAQCELYESGYVCHNKGKHLTDEEKASLRIKCSCWHHTKEAISSMIEKRTGTRWYTNGEINIRTKGDCPEGFKPGMTVHKGD